MSTIPHLFLYVIIRISYNKTTWKWHTLKVILHMVCFIAKATPTLRVRSKVWLLEAQDPKSCFTFLYFSALAEIWPHAASICIFALWYVADAVYCVFGAAESIDGVGGVAVGGVESVAG